LSENVVLTTHLFELFHLSAVTPSPA